MSLENLFSAFSAKMQWLTQREATIGENVANANSPGYKPKDLESFAAVMQKTGGTSAAGGSGFAMNVTQPGHLSAMHGGTGPYKTTTSSDLYETKLSGNAVILEQEMTKLADTNSQYQMITGLYRKTIGMVKTALGKSA